MLSTEISKPRAPQSLSPSAKAAPLSKGVVLLVEDEEDLRTLLTFHLQKAKFTVLTAENGRVAFEILNGRPPDLVLLDILMPELDGWEVCRKIREHENGLISSIPVIMLTALRSEKDKFKGLRLGADAFINKPYSLEEVLLHCHNFVQGRQKHLALLESRKNEQCSPTKSIYQLLLHELRNHLTIIGGMARLLSISKTNDLKETEYLCAISKSSQYLEMIVNDIQLFEQVEAKTLMVPSDPFDLNEMINDIVQMLQTSAKEKRISLFVALAAEPTFVHLNQTALKIVLATIFENAVKYCCSGSRIEISAGKNDETTSISISDDGPGISADEKPHIFEKNFRAVKAKQLKSGSGLGLYFAKILTEVMNGTITVDSLPGKGSTFTVSFKEYTVISSGNLEQS